MASVSNRPALRSSLRAPMHLEGLCPTLIKPQTFPEIRILPGVSRGVRLAGAGCPRVNPNTAGPSCGRQRGRPWAPRPLSLPLWCWPWGEHARRVSAGRSPGQALTKPGAVRDMPGGLHTSWNRFQPLRLPMLHFDPAKPVAPVAGAGAGPILSLCPIPGAWKRLFHHWGLVGVGGAAEHCCARAGGITMALGT